jgi:hypothetical protein
MRTKSKCKVRLCLIYSLWMHRLYLGYKNKLCVEFIYKCVHLYSIVFTSARKMFRILEVFGFRNFGDEGYSTCASNYWF